MRLIGYINLHNSFFKSVCSFRERLFPNAMGESGALLSTGTAASLKRELEDTAENGTTKKSKVEFQRVKKRKYAVLICYSGQGYLGLQRNPGMKTIEDDLLSALLKAGVINDEAYENPKLLDFQRAARTDKGVSAVKQVLSAKLPLEVCLKTVNSFLPDQIRMVDMKRSTKGFNSKGSCDARTYSYMMPTFALAPQDVLISEDYRVTPEIIARLNIILESYLGTHNFHNFTSRKKPMDPSAKRYMVSFNCSDPFIEDGMEFVMLKVKGQSFMLHQIRKMVGLAIAIVRGLAHEETISKAYGEERLDLPVAPGIGLVLEEVHYERYNQRFGKDGIHEPIEWSSVEKELEEFRKVHILPTIITAEKEEKSMYNWLSSLPLHSFDVRREQRNEGSSSVNNTEECDVDKKDKSNGKTSG